MAVISDPTTVTFAGGVTLDGQGDSPEFSLDNLDSLTGSGTCTLDGLVSTDDLTVTGAGTCTLDGLVSTDDLTVTGAATVGETFVVTGRRR